MRSGDWDQKQEVVRLVSDCMTCVLKKELEKIPDEVPEEQRFAYKQKVLRIGQCTADNGSV